MAVRITDVEIVLQPTGRSSRRPLEGERAAVEENVAGSADGLELRAAAVGPDPHGERVAGHSRLAEPSRRAPQPRGVPAAQRVDYEPAGDAVGAHAVQDWPVARLEPRPRVRER